MDKRIKTLNYIVTIKDDESTNNVIRFLRDQECVLSIVATDNMLIKDTKIVDEHVTKNKFKTDALSTLLRKLSILPSHNGFQYLEASIEYKILSSEQQISITKVIYPYVAKKFGSTPNRVERCMRKAIEYAWNNNGKQHFEEAAGCTLNKKPSNSQFISLITEYINANREEFFE